jgi:hypothetical protein
MAHIVLRDERIICKRLWFLIVCADEPAIDWGKVIWKERGF